MSQKAKPKTEQSKSFEECVIEILEKIDKRGDPSLNTLVADLRANYGKPSTPEQESSDESPSNVGK